MEDKEKRRDEMSKERKSVRLSESFQNKKEETSGGRKERKREMMRLWKWMKTKSKQIFLSTHVCLCARFLGHKDV